MKSDSNFIYEIEPIHRPDKIVYGMEQLEFTLFISHLVKIQFFSLHCKYIRFPWLDILYGLERVSVRLYKGIVIDLCLLSFT